MSDLKRAAEVLRERADRWGHTVSVDYPAELRASAALLDELADSERSLAEHDGLDPYATIDGYAQAKALAAAILREA